MNGNFIKEDVVTVALDQVAQNGGDITLTDTAYIIAKKFDNGEPMYNLIGLNDGSKIFIREDKEYAFIDDELELLCSKEAYTS